MPFSGFQDFTPQFGGSLQQFLAASPGISVGSGYRSPEHQAELYQAAVQKYGSPGAARHWVAPPGKSRHNMRLAADLQFKDDAARAWAHANAAKYGLTFPMGHEPWHVELLGARSGSAPTSASTTSVGDTAAVLANATQPPDPRYDLSKLAQDAADRLTNGSAGNDPVLRETPTGAASPPLENALVSALDNVSPQRNTRTPLSPSLTPLADLFQVKAIGQAGTPQLPGRRF
jgi:hypothetical protein